MPEAAVPSKSPKTSRRLKPGGETLRQVHFPNGSNNNQSNDPRTTTTSASPQPEINSNTTPSNTKSEAAPVDNQPTSYPQLGVAPNSNAGAGPWYTAADPSQTVRFPGQPCAGFPTAGFTSAPHQAHFFAHQTAPQFSAPITYIGQHPLHPHGNPVKMADYQNAGPFQPGVNFQPPVPDTTFGPMPHVYVPRFDAGGFIPGVQQPTGAGAGFAQPSYYVAQQPGLVPQPIVGQQPVMINGQPFMAAAGQPMQTVPAMGFGGGIAAMGGAIPVIAGNNGQIPEISGLGRTPTEETLRQVQFAHSNKMFEPQDFKPSDDDPSRFYYVREIDGNWTQRNRFTIDRLGDCRWYVTDEGWFYAIRLPD